MKNHTGLNSVLLGFWFSNLRGPKRLYMYIKIGLINLRSLHYSLKKKWNWGYNQLKSDKPGGNEQIWSAHKNFQWVFLLLWNLSFFAFGIYNSTRFVGCIKDGGKFIEYVALWSSRLRIPTLFLSDLMFTGFISGRFSCKLTQQQGELTFGHVETSALCLMGTDCVNISREHSLKIISKCYY